MGVLDRKDKDASVEVSAAVPMVDAEADEYDETRDGALLIVDERDEQRE